MTRRRHPRPSVALSVLLLALGTSVPSLASAADPTRVLSDYRVTSWTEQDGLPTGTIWSIAQDADGFLWLGADAGLIRFDGARFTTPETIGVAGIRQGAVHAVFASRDGSLWIGFADGGIARLRRKQLVVYGVTHGLQSGAITSITQDHTGIVWAATDRGVYRFRNDRWQRVDDAAGLAGSVATVSVSPGGDVVVGSRTTVFRRPPADERFEVVHDGNEPLVDAVQDNVGRVWITDRIAGFRIAGTTSSRPGQQNGKGTRLMVDRSGSIWVATFGQGLWRVRTNTDDQARQIEVATDVNGLSNNVIYALFEDREGNIWAGTTDGLNRLTQNRVAHILNLGLVTGLEPAPGGDVWAATAEGLVRLSRAGQEVRRLPGLQPRATHVDPEGTLWVATDAGLLQVRGSTEPRVVASAAQGVRSITSDPRGGVLMLCSDGRMLRFADGRLEPVSLPAGIERRPSSLFTTQDGTVWIAAAGSLVAIAIDGHIRTYSRAEGLDIGASREFFEDSRGALWVAGSDGLARVHDGRVTSVHRAEGLPSESLTGIVEDVSGNLWIGSATGIMRLNASAFAEDEGNWGAHFAIYDSSDGVAGTTGWIGQRSALRASDGRFWFLTASGVTVIDPTALRRDVIARPLRIEQIAADDNRFIAEEVHTIEPRVSRLQINFSVPNLTSPRRTRFRYQLEGFDSGWIDAGRQRVATYTNLPPRTYTFVVQATSADGVWEGPRAAWQFSVQPAFYQTIWFSASCVVALGGLGWMAWRIRVLQVRRQFALLLAERTRLSRELHDTLLQSFVGVALQCDALASEADAIQSSTLGAGLVRLRKQVEGYIRECRQSIWELRSATLDENDLLQALDDATKRATADSGLAVQLTVTGTSRRCERRIEEQILRIAQEASTNAARHSRGRILRVELAYEPDKITLGVDDDGCGFDPLDPLHRLQGHYGLVSMRERAETVGGSLSIASKGGAGTSIRVVIPSAADGRYLEDESFHADSVHGRSSDRTRRNRTDHQPAA